MTSLMSFTPLLMALSLKNGLCDAVEIISARVVFPVPGGPHNIKEGMVPFLMWFVSDPCWQQDGTDSNNYQDLWVLYVLQEVYAAWKMDLKVK